MPSVSSNSEQAWQHRFTKIKTLVQLSRSFWFSRISLKSLSTGLFGSDNINCDNAEAVGEATQNPLDNICIEDAVIQIKALVYTLQLLKSGVKIDSRTVHINPLILFTRLTVSIQRDQNVEQNFKYKLSSESSTMFKNKMMQKNWKSVLRNHLLNKYPSCDCPSSKSAMIDIWRCFVTKSGFMVPHLQTLLIPI